MKRWSDGSLAKHLSNLQARHYEDDTRPAQNGEVKVLLSSIWPEADVVEGLTIMLRSLVDAIEDAALKEHPCYRTVEAMARLATQVLEVAEHWDRAEALGLETAEHWEDE
jgi:hypothetical protein